MRIKQILQECVPDAYYSNGIKSTCLVYKICNMFDIDSQSFKEVKEKKNMENSFKESDYKFIDRFLEGKGKKESVSN